MTLVPEVRTQRLRARPVSPALKNKLKFAGVGLGVAIAALIFPRLTLFYVMCGLCDVARNRRLDASLLRQYFFGNGVTTWLLSPLNILLDLLTLPYVNRGIYRLDDLPARYRAEVERVIEVAEQENIVGQLEARAKELDRTMIFFKWYGENVDTFLDTPAFHGRWDYVQTIGVSVFNRKISTSRHFGPIRPTLRVLYSLNEIEDRSAYIVVGDEVSYWKDDKLFIFDDTLVHQSFNNSEKIRYCLFVDIVRPSLVPQLLRFVVRLVHYFFQGANSIFYKKWKVIR
jgi:beta-hydroxylase